METSEDIKDKHPRDYVPVERVISEDLEGERKPRKHRWEGLTMRNNILRVVIGGFMVAIGITFLLNSYHVIEGVTTYFYFDESQVIPGVFLLIIGAIVLIKDAKGYLQD